MKRYFVIDVSHAPAPFFEVASIDGRMTIGEAYDNDSHVVEKTFVAGKQGKNIAEWSCTQAQLDRAFKNAKSFALKKSGKKRVTVI